MGDEMEMQSIQRIVINTMADLWLERFLNAQLNFQAKEALPEATAAALGTSNDATDQPNVTVVMPALPSPECIQRSTRTNVKSKLTSQTLTASAMLSNRTRRSVDEKLILENMDKHPHDCPDIGKYIQRMAHVKATYRMRDILSYEGARDDVAFNKIRDNNSNKRRKYE